MMMIKTHKLIHIFFMSAIAIAISACVPKATENKAACGTNMAFSNVTRSCFSIVAPNKAPVVASFTAPTVLIEDVAISINLPYTDFELDKATDCQLSSLSHVTVTSCICTVTSCDAIVKGVSNYNGTAQFSYNVKANNMVSNTAVVSLTINPVNDAPTLTAITSLALPLSTSEDIAKNITFAIADVDNTLACNSNYLSATSTNAALVPATLISGVDITFSGTIGACVVSIHPLLNQSGSTIITLSLTDGIATPVTSTFTLNVSAVNDKPTVSPFISTQTTLEDTPISISFAINDVDNTLLCNSTFLSISSSSVLLFSALLVPGVEVTYAGTNLACVATITPLLNTNGTTLTSPSTAAVLTITVNDGSGTTTATESFNPFILNVTPVNDAPVITAVTPIAFGNQTSVEDVPLSITVALSDVDNTLSCNSTSLSVTSSNLTLVPLANVTYSGSLAACVVTFTPVTDQSGFSNIVLKVTDGIIPVPVSVAFKITFTFVDDPPYFNPAATTADTNEGGMVVAGPFKINEDQGSTTDEDKQILTFTSIVSDNTNVLTSAINPSTSSAIRIFYDQNDNGVEDTGEERDLNSPIEHVATLASTIGIGDTVVTVDSTTDYPTSGTIIIESENITYTGKTATTFTGLTTTATHSTLGPAIAVFGADAFAHSFYLKLYPVAGVSGNSNITISTASDGIPTSIVYNFSLIVHSVAALHGGWTNISAVGIKTNKSGEPVSLSDNKCNYNKSTNIKHCDTSDNNCTKAYAPHGTVTPDAVNVLFWDSGNRKCYRSQSTSKFSWVDVTTSCPITRISITPTTLSAGITAADTSMSVASTANFPTKGILKIGTEQISYFGKTINSFTGLVRGLNSTTAAIHLINAVVDNANGENFIKDSTASPAQGTPVATAINQYYYNFDSNPVSCHSSVETSPGTWSWDAVAFVPSKVTLSWNAFTVSGSGPDINVQADGWNIYRREKGFDYDFNAGFLKVSSSDSYRTITNANVRTFTDTTAAAGKVYYYMVRPVDNTSRHLTISTSEIFSEVRILAPVENYSFVHRWMVNQEICNSMLMTSTTTKKVDPTHNYRCPYKGPGEGTGSNIGYYDIGKDMLVDISENGCPYSSAPACTANGCIGIGSPTSLGLSASSNSIYYDRNSGFCYINNNGLTGWTDYNSATAGLVLSASSKVNTALNAPLTNISKTKSELVCSNRLTSNATSLLGIANGGTKDPPTYHSLPSKKEYMGYSAAPIGVSDTVISDMEEGNSLNIQSRCNGSSANGLEIAYTDSNIPSTSFIYSLPGTSSSGIKSLYTGSVPWVSNFSTETCSSRYGVQDVYGNVAEWVEDSMTCDVMKNTTLTTFVDEFDVGSISVVSGASFPASGTITIGSEDISYTVITLHPATTGTPATPAYVTLDVLTRGVNSTTASDHAITELVYYNGLTANNFLCKTIGGSGGTALERFDFQSDTYSSTPTNSYAFNLITGPYNDTNASSTMSLGDGFLNSWDFREKLFGAGKFNFPMGMPMYVDIGSSIVSASAAIPYLLDIGPTNGITEDQLHRDGIIVNGAKVNNIVANPNQTGSFAQGGSYLSGARAGRYSSELVPDAEVRPDIGFRCYIPVDTGNYPADAGRHTYSY